MASDVISSVLPIQLALVLLRFVGLIVPITHSQKNCSRILYRSTCTRNLQVTFKINSAVHPSWVYVNRVPTCLAGVKAGRVYFTCVGWQVTLCDPIWQVTFRSSVMHELSPHIFNFCLRYNFLRRFFTATCFSNVAVMGSLDVRPSVCL